MKILIASLLLLALSTTSRAQPASNLYLLNCWGCHGSHGEGISGTAPPLIGLADFLKANGGRAYLIQVPGVSLSALDDADIATVMNWVLKNMSKGHLPSQFVPYTAEEVHRYRVIRLAELSKTRKGLLDQLVMMKVRTTSD